MALHEFLGEALAGLQLRRGVVGPKIGQPRRWNSSTTPSVSGSSGPTTVRSGLSLLASCTSESRLLRSAATHSASAAMPPLPGAQ